MIANAHKAAKLDVKFTFTPVRVLYEAPSSAKGKLDRVKKLKGLVVIEWLDSCGDGADGDKSWVLTLWESHQHYTESQRLIESELTLTKPLCTFMRVWNVRGDHWFSHIKWSQAVSYLVGIIGGLMALVTYGKQLALPAAEVKAEVSTFYVSNMDASPKFDLALTNLADTGLTATLQSVTLETAPKPTANPMTSNTIPRLTFPKVLVSVESGKSSPIHINCDGVLPAGSYKLRLQGRIKAGLLAPSDRLDAPPFSIVSLADWQETEDDRTLCEPVNGSVWVTCHLITGKAFPSLTCEAALTSDAAEIKGVSMSGDFGVPSKSGTTSKIRWQSGPLAPFQKYTFNIYLDPRPGRAPDWKVEKRNLKTYFDDMAGVGP